MPNDNDNNHLPELSIEEINELYSDIIEFPDDIRVAAAGKASIGGAGCATGVDPGK